MHSHPELGISATLCAELEQLCALTLSSWANQQNWLMLQILIHRFLRAVRNSSADDGLPTHVEQSTLPASPLFFHALSLCRVLLAGLERPSHAARHSGICQPRA